MSDLTYNARRYVRFTADEFLAIILTSAVVAFIISMRDLLFERFGEPAGFQAAGLLFLFVLFVMVVTVWICKIVALNLGHIITYKAHTIGLFAGLAITFMSVGYLPIFLPGGFAFNQPERLRVGKFLGTHKGWEIGLIAGTFPLAILLFILVFNPLYLLSRSELYLNIIVACVLLAIYACIPLPMFDFQHHDRLREWYRYLRGATFGLDVLYSSRTWYVVLCCTILFFSAIAYLLTLVGFGVGIAIYAFSLILGVIGLWVYTRFFKV